MKQSSYLPGKWKLKFSAKSTGNQMFFESVPSISVKSSRRV